MIRDSLSARVWTARRYTLKGKDNLPVIIYTGHPVATDPTGDPRYIDGQVADILVELQEAPLAPFVEGTAIGTTDTPKWTAVMCFGIPNKAYHAMSERVWKQHKKRTTAEKRAGYTILRTAAGMLFRFEWDPQLRMFRVNRNY